MARYRIRAGDRFDRLCEERYDRSSDDVLLAVVRGESGFVDGATAHARRVHGTARRHPPRARDAHTLAIRRDGAESRPRFGFAVRRRPRGRIPNHNLRHRRSRARPRSRLRRR